MGLNILLAYLILVIPLNLLLISVNGCFSGFINNFGETALTDISNIKSTQDQIMRYKEFLNRMKLQSTYSSATIMLGYLVGELKVLHPENKDLDYILKSLPPEISKIPWNKNLYIYNKETSEYLCVNDEPDPAESLNDKVFSSSVRNTKCLWHFNVESSGRYFTIQNIANKRYIVADDEHRSISTVDNTTYAIPYESDKWQLEPSRNDKADIFEYKIKNYKWQAYIIGDQSSSDVFVKKDSHCSANLCQWGLMSEKKHKRRLLTTGLETLPVEREKLLKTYYGHFREGGQSAENLLQYAINSSTRIAEYVNIFKLMSQYNGFYSVAGPILDYNVKQLLPQYPDDFDLQEMNKHFRTLWKPLRWNHLVLIRNKANNKTLCWPNSSFMYRAQMLTTKEPCYWELESDPSGIYFRIKNFPHISYYLVVETRAMTDWIPRRVMLSNSNINEQARWQLIPRPTGDHEVQLKNVYWQEMLFSNDEVRPSTVLDPDCINMGCQWTFEYKDKQ